MENIIWEDENLLRFKKEDFERFLEWSFDLEASDILIESGQKLAVMLNDDVYEVGRRPILYAELMEILQKAYQPAAPTIVAREDIDFAYSILRDDNSIIRFRVNATSCQGSHGSSKGVEIVLRTIASEPVDHQKLGIEKDIIDVCDSSSGLILVTGPTGSGKTTIIASLLKHLCQTKRKHIICYEDPIEFDLKSVPNRKSRVVQSEVGNHLSTFVRSVRNSLRRAPHIVFFGESRDKETIRGCIREAQTGHLVLTTLHTTSISIAIARMADEFGYEERKSIAGKLVDSIRLIVNQRLINNMNGGRTAIREYLVFTEKMRRHLEMCLLKKDDVTHDVHLLLQEHGQPLLSDVKNKFKEGCFDLTEYVQIVTEVGAPSDMDIVPEVALDLRAKGIIDSDTYDSWVQEYEQLSDIEEEDNEDKDQEGE